MTRHQARPTDSCVYLRIIASFVVNHGLQQLTTSTEAIALHVAAAHGPTHSTLLCLITHLPVCLVVCLSSVDPACLIRSKARAIRFCFAQIQFLLPLHYIVESPHYRNVCGCEYFCTARHFTLCDDDVCAAAHRSRTIVLNQSVSLSFATWLDGCQSVGDYCRSIE